MFRKACVCAINMWLPKLFVKKGVVTVQQIVKQKGLLWFLDFCWSFWGRKFIVSLTERSSNFDGGILSEKMQVSGFGRAMIKSTDESKWNESSNIMKHQSNIMTDDDRWIACRNCSFQGTILGHDRSEPSLRVPAAYGHQCVDWLLCIPVFPFWNHKISKSGDPPKIHQLGFSWKLMDNWIMLFGLFLMNFSKSAQAVFFPENLLLSIHIVIPFSFPLCGKKRRWHKNFSNTSTGHDGGQCFQSRTGIPIGANGRTSESWKLQSDGFLLDGWCVYRHVLFQRHYLVIFQAIGFEES